MGKITLPNKVKVIIGILFSKEWFDKNYGAQDINKHSDFISKEVIKHFQAIKEYESYKITSVSEVIKFEFSSYYDKELGNSIYRYWIGLSPNINIENLHKIKLATNKIEQELFFQKYINLRKINIDPGYIDGSKLVLFSTKNFSHRIYLAEGIYAESTLIYKHSKFEALPWTYPDYKTDTAISFFNKIRIEYLKSLKNN